MAQSDMIYNYILLDGAIWEEDMELAWQFDIPYRSLYRGKPAVDLNDVAPYLFCLTEHIQRMTKFFSLVFLAMLFCETVSAQIKKTNSDMKLIYKEYLHPDSVMYREFGYEDDLGRRQGEWIMQYPGWKVHEKGPYVDGKKHGIWVTVEDNSQATRREVMWSNGTKKVQAYYDGREPVLKEEFWVNEKGQLMGDYKSFYETGEEESKGHYEWHKKIGHWQFFYASKPYCHSEKDNINCRFPNGVFTELTPPAGIIRGFVEPYSTEGNISCLKCEGEYVNNDPQGTWVWYYPSGERWFECDFHEGERHGIWRGWLRDGSLYGEVQYSNGMLGPGIFYNDEGVSIFVSVLGKVRQYITALEGVDAIRPLPRERVANEKDGYLLWDKAINRNPVMDSLEIKCLADRGYIIRPQYMDKLVSRYYSFLTLEKTSDVKRQNIENLKASLDYLFHTYGVHIPWYSLLQLFYIAEESSRLFIGNANMDYFFNLSEYSPTSLLYGDNFLTYAEPLDFLSLCIGSSNADVDKVRYLLDHGVNVTMSHIERAMTVKKNIEDNIAYYSDPNAELERECDYDEGNLRNINKIINSLKKAIKITE